MVLWADKPLEHVSPSISPRVAPRVRAAVKIVNLNAESGFDEIWLANYCALRKDMHREIEMLGLHPETIRNLTRRPDYDNKPYG